jgi:hypothetical protein
MQKDARQLTQLLSQLARLEVRPHAQWLEEALSVVEGQMPLLNADDLCGCMRALAAWGWSPSTGLLAALEGRAAEAISRGGFSARQLGELAWTYAQLGLRHRCGRGTGGWGHDHESHLFAAVPPCVAAVGKT